ncbi:hypothetical protein BAC1_00531 [uncultured bacterium]|nr:hypothetical protein BAC1_00531 [uncultured bacterium]
MAESIKEEIKVVAVFDRGLKPVKFRWRGRLYIITEVTHTWSSRHGASGILHYAVTDGATLFELAYNQSTMRWSIEASE